MKDSNYNYIKEQFDNCGVNAPGSLDESEILKKLEGTQPIKALPPKKGRKKLVAGISAAAAVAVVTAGALAFSSILGDPPEVNVRQMLGDPPEVKFSQMFGDTAALRSFNDLDEVKRELKNAIEIKEQIKNHVYGGDKIIMDFGADSSSSGAAGGGSTGESGGDQHNSTYTQSLGVDEADCVKTSDKYIFYLRDNAIDIFTAEGKQSKLVASVVPQDKNSYISEFYIAGSRLVSMTTGGYSINRDWNPVVSATVYDFSNISNIRSLGSFKQSGDYVSSRMIDDTLYLISDQDADDENKLPMASVPGGATKDSASFSELPADSIYSVENPCVSSFLIVSSIDTKNGANALKSKAILGSGENVYCNKQNLYITALQYSPETFYEISKIFSNSIVNIDGVYYTEKRPDMTQIVKINLEKGIEFIASDRVKGLVNNQYSFDEYNGNLRVATTSYNEEFREENHLIVLDKNLKQLGEVSGFAPDESIKAVRYINETAYVITYKQTDPLFVIDVSDPVRPQIKGEVKISGFSTMLVPVDDNTLLGIGFQTNDSSAGGLEVQTGLKLVTFDVTDKSDPQVIDTKVFDYYDSAVQYNPRALLVNNERGDYTIPFRRDNWVTMPDADSDSNFHKYYGIINFRIDNGKIIIVDEYTSDLFSRLYCSAHRCVYVGDTVYLLGTNGESDNYSRPKKYHSAIDSVKYK